MLDALSAALVEQGLAVWSGSEAGEPAQLIVRGRANLLDSVSQGEDLERLKLLFDDLETKQGMLQLLDIAEAVRACGYSLVRKTAVLAVWLIGRGRPLPRFVRNGS